jgi:hypothetical protein
MEFYEGITIVPGVEITHVPKDEHEEKIAFARSSVYLCCGPRRTS